jgi:hypothetical protein
MVVVIAVLVQSIVAKIWPLDCLHSEAETLGESSESTFANIAGRGTDRL